MFERYTEQARRAIFYAKVEALHRGSDEIATRDLILGITRQTHPPGCLLPRFHEKDSKLRELLDAGEKLTHMPAQQRNIPLSRESKMTLAFAAKEADRDSRFAIGVDHLMRGILRTGDNTADKLKIAGYELNAVRSASRQAYQTWPDMSGHARWKKERFQRRVSMIAMLVLGLGLMILISTLG